MDTKITIVNTKDEHTVFVACNARSNGSICICISIECHRLHTKKKIYNFDSGSCRKKWKEGQLVTFCSILF